MGWPANRIRTLIFCLIGLTGACDRKEEVAKLLTPVRTGMVETLMLNQGIHYSASVVPYSQVDLSFKVGGYIRSILQVKGADGRMRDLQQNDRVTKGEILARVEQTQYRDKVIEAEAGLARADAAFSKSKDDDRRARNLYRTQSITQREYDSARKEYESDRAEVESASAKLNNARNNLSYTSLSSPSDGVILQRNIEVGSLVNLGAVGFVLADVSSVKVVFAIPDLMLKTVKPGDLMSVSTGSLPGKRFDGKITAIAAEADSRTRTFEIEISISNPDNALKPGMIASLSVSPGAQQQSPMVIPLSAIVRSKRNPSGYAVYLIDRSQPVPSVKLRDIDVGSEIFGNRIEVTQGLEAGQSLVITGTGIVSDGEQVQIIP